MTLAARPKPAARAALETPYQRDHEASLQRRMTKGQMPKDLPDLLRWFDAGWGDETPPALHRAEVYHAEKQDQDKRGACRCDHTPLHTNGCCHSVDGAPLHPLGGYEAIPRDRAGSALGTRAHTDAFKRLLERWAQETDEDGYYVRPMRAAIGRLARSHPMTARALFALAMSGFRWRDLAERGHWEQEMFRVYIAEALRMLWREHSDVEVRLH